MVAPFSKFYGKIWVDFCLNTGKRFFLEVTKTVLGIFKITLRLRNGHVFMRQSLGILTF